MKYIKLFENFKEWEELGGSESGSESYSLQDFYKASIKNSSEDDHPDTVKIWTPFWNALKDKAEWDKIILLLVSGKMNAISLKNLLGVPILLSTKLVKFFKSPLGIEPTKLEILWFKLKRLEELKYFFKSGGTGLESEKIRGIYKHFKNDGSIDDLEPILKNLYKDSPGIFNFSNFTEEQFIEIIDKVGEDNKSFRELLDKRDDTPSFDISHKGTAYLR